MKIFPHFDGFCYRIRTKAQKSTKLKRKKDRARLFFIFIGRKGLKLMWLAENFI